LDAHHRLLRTSRCRTRHGKQQHERAGAPHTRNPTPFEQKQRSD
jgi:hypothetical protein